MKKTTLFMIFAFGFYQMFGASVLTRIFPVQTLTRVTGLIRGFAEERTLARTFYQLLGSVAQGRAGIYDGFRRPVYVLEDSYNVESGYNRSIPISVADSNVFLNICEFDRLSFGSKVLSILREYIHTQQFKKYCDNYVGPLEKPFMTLRSEVYGVFYEREAEINASIVWNCYRCTEDVANKVPSSADDSDYARYRAYNGKASLEDYKAIIKEQRAHNCLCEAHRFLLGAGINSPEKEVDRMADIEEWILSGEIKL